MSGRYAVYVVPRAERGLGRFGAGWLGWDADAGGEVAAPAPEGLPLAREAIVARPRRYGFHATLKAPFRLAEGCAPAALAAALGRIAAGHRRFILPLGLEALGPFLALTPRAPSPPLEALAADCVTGLDGFRAPPEPEELARRRAGGLSAEEEAMLERWGYPYALGTFRFHMTLSGPLPEADRAATARVLGRVLSGVPTDLEIAEVCLCGEGGDGRFRVLERLALDAG